MAEQYGYKSSGDANKVGYGPLNGPFRHNLTKSLAYSTSDEEIVVTDVESMHLGLEWSSPFEERISAGVRLEGVASEGASGLRIGITRGEDFDVAESWAADLLPGANLLMFPWVLNRPPEGRWRYRMTLRTDTGVFTIPAGKASWYVVRRG